MPGEPAFSSLQDSPRPQVLSLTNNDRIHKVVVRCGALVDRMELHTVQGHRLAAGGSGGGLKEVSIVL
jgi:hypothetical protein